MNGLVVEGGASRTYFSAGVLDAFLDNKVSFDYIVGVSAGISTAMNYASSQKGRSLQIGLEYVPSKKYSGLRHMLNPKNRSLFNIKFVFDDIPNKLVLYDYDALKKFKGKAEAVVTNVKTGKPEYISAMPNGKNWDNILASCSLPLMFPMCKVNGTKYFDGGICDSIPYMRAIESGCDKIVVILSRERNYQKPSKGEANFASLFYKRYPNFVSALKNRGDMYNNQRKNLFDLEKQGKALIIEPTDTSSWARTENSANMLKKMYDEGFDTSEKRMKEIKSYLGIA